MNNVNVNLIQESFKKIQKVFENIEEKGVNDNNIISYSSKLEIFVREIYEYLDMMSDNELKEEISIKVDETLKKVHSFTENFDMDLFESTKDSINFMYQYLEDKKQVIVSKEDLIALYNTKLNTYKEALKECKRKMDLYKEGKIPYELYYESSVVSYDIYLELTGLHNQIGNTELELPKTPPKILRSAEDLKLKTFLDNMKYYESFLGTYEDYFEDYVEQAKKYDANQISYDKYEVSASLTNEMYIAAKKAYEDVLREFREIESNFSNDMNYYVVSQEELDTFYKELEEYNRELEEYNKELEVLGELKDKLSQGLITQDEYDAKFKKVEQMQFKLQEKKLYLSRKRKVIYNSSVLSNLEEQKTVIEAHLKITTISEEERTELIEKLTGITNKVGEVKRFRETVKVKQVKTIEEKFKITTTIRRKGQKKTKKPEFDLQEPSPFFAFGKRGNSVSKVVKVKKWVKTNKKKILIALGLAALAVCLVVLVTQLMPALVSAQQLVNVSNLMGVMQQNGSMWWAASAAEKAALHGANTGIASWISGATGMATTYTEATGVWTIGGEVLATAAKTAATKAAAATKLVAALKGTSLVSGLGGLGLLGAGLLGGESTEDYKRIRKEIKHLQKNIKILPKEDWDEQAQKIWTDLNSCKKNNIITEKEYSILLKKMQSVVTKKVNYNNKMTSGYSNETIDSQSVKNI